MPELRQPVTGRLELFPDMTTVLAGSLDDPSAYKPAMNIFTASAPSWDHMDPTLSKYVGAPEL